MDYAYHVLPQGQVTRTVLSPVGTGFRTVREITFQVDSGPATGTHDTIQIPAEVEDVDTIRNMIEARIHHLSAVAGLGRGHGKDD